MRDIICGFAAIVLVWIGASLELKRKKAQRDSRIEPTGDISDE